MYIETQVHSDAARLVFLPHYMLLDSGKLEFKNPEQAEQFPLAKMLFEIEGVKAVTVGIDYVAVTHANDADVLLVEARGVERITQYLTPLLPKAGPSSTGLLAVEGTVLAALLLF